MDVPEGLLIEELAGHTTVVAMSFDTGCLQDSGSAPDLKGAVVTYQARSFRDQSCLIAHATKCVFLTEGDLGSHTYLPPFLGKDVVVVAYQDMFDRPSSPIDFLNQHVFRFGGQVIPWVVEATFRNPQTISERVDSLLEQS